MSSSSLTTLLPAYILSILPSSRHLALVCSSGSLGYHAFKEMLESGEPGSIVLVESCDLRSVDDREEEGDGVIATTTPTACCLIYAIDPRLSKMDIFPEYSRHIPDTISEVTVYTNMKKRLTGNLLYSCKGLSTINLAPLSNVVPPFTTLESSFLSRTGIRTIDLTPLSHLKDVGSFFLHKNTMLSSVNLAPLSNLNRINNSFLSDCTSLTEIDLTPLSKVVKVDWFFLKGCSGLKKIDLAPLSHLTSIVVGFLQECSGLTDIDLSPLSNVTSVERCFLQGCTGLKSIDLTPLSRITTVHASFLQGCSGLSSINLSPLAGVTEVQSYFLAGCTGLQTIDLSPMIHLKKAPVGFQQPSSGDATTTDVVLPTHLAK